MSLLPHNGPLSKQAILQTKDIVGGKEEGVKYGLGSVEMTAGMGRRTRETFFSFLPPRGEQKCL